jgi:hypothetical protein
MELLISIVVAAGAIEVYAWLPIICQRLVEFAVSGLPTEDQERCREEWTANLEALPNSALRISHALSFILAARRIAADFWEMTFDELDGFVVDIAATRQDVQNKHNMIVERVEKLRSYLLAEETEHNLSTQRLVVTLAKAKDAVVGAQQTRLPAALAEEVIGSIQHVSAALPTANERFLGAFKTETEKLLKRSDQFSSALRTLNVLLQKHALSLQDLRTREPSKDLETAIVKFCEDAIQDWDAWHNMWEAVVEDTDEMGNTAFSDANSAALEFNDVLAPLRAATEKLRSYRASQTHNAE